jgi:hypothetical protein
MKLAVLSMYTIEMQGLAQMANQNKAAYCRRHGYDYLVADRVLDRSRPPAWSKILHVQQHLADYDWVFWSDCDSLVMNPEIRLEQLIDDKYDFLITRDPSGLNSGEFFLRNCPAAFEFLETVYAQTEVIHNPWWEQRAIIDVILSGQHSLRIKECPQREFNSYLDSYVKGDFMLHFAGIPEREGIMRIYYSLTRGGDSACGGDLESYDHISLREHLSFLLNHLGLCGTGVEVGVQAGVFSAVWAQLWEGQRLCLVDPWRYIPGYADVAKVRDSAHESLYEHVLQLFGDSSKVQVMRTTSLEAVTEFEDESLDWVYLDADHSYLAMRAELEAWYPKLRGGAMFAGHDFVDGKLAEGDFGVKSAVEEFARTHGLKVHLTREAGWKSWFLFKPFDHPSLGHPSLDVQALDRKELIPYERNASPSAFGKAAVGATLEREATLGSEAASESEAVACVLSLF